MLIDDITIQLKAGKGGDGAVAFSSVKMMLGPTGASGGNGGNIFLKGVSDLGALIHFKHKKEFKAENGEKGKIQFRDGVTGKDLILNVPVGTTVHNLTTKKDFDITLIGQKLLVARGGKGGKGNFKFRSSRNTSPKEFQRGTLGEEFAFRLELKLIADIGFVGLPNIGKSSLLNAITNAKSKVANYAFTTLEPSLGVYYELILADIPGLIEGASSGKGLGIKFLRHIERTKIIFHFISAESSSPLLDYQVIRKELGLYSPKLLKKPEYILLSKADAVTPKELEQKLKILKKVNPKTFAISIIDDEKIKDLEKMLRKIIQEKKSS